MGRGRKAALVAGMAVIAGAAVAQPQPQQKVTGPVAVYWMSAATQTGFGMPGAGGGGGKPSMGQIMGMLGGGGGGAQHSLNLDLGSSRTAQGEPAAEHLAPQGLGAGQSLPLLTPKIQPQAPREEAAPSVPREYQKPKGRMLIFWGCGEHARPGQPVVFDFAQISAGKIPPGMEALTRGLGARAMQPPSPGRSKTYGGWPNEKTRTQVPSRGSLLGDHLVKGNYNPDINFTLGEGQDFLGPLNLTTNAKNPSGSAQLGWNAVTGAQAYLASVVGAGQDETVVLWSSSETSSAGFAMPDYITPGDLSRLVASKALMSPQTTSCTVPKEVMDAAPQGFLQMVAYGGEANFVYPERPKDPKVTWNQEWQVKVRYRSATGGLLGMSMPSMGGGGDESAAARRGGQSPQGAQQQQPAPQTPEEEKAARRKAIMKGLGGALLGIPY